MLKKHDVDDVLVQGDYQSGDRYTVASALRLNPKLGVLILTHRNKREAAIELKSMYDKAAGARRVEIADLGRATDGADEIKRVPQSSYSKVKSLINELIEAINGKKANKVWRDNWRIRWPKFLKNGIEAGINLQIATYGTKVVAGKFEADPGGSQSSLRQYFKGPHNKEAGLQQWLEGRGFKFGPHNKYVLLWAKRGQQTAEKAHHFTSYVALSRIAHEIRSKTAYTPVATGDKLFLDTQPSLAQFWDEPSWKKLFPTAGRTEQLHVYEYLARNCDVLSIGTRSGALELPALLGIRTLYLEEVANEQAERMERWIGKVPRFSRLIVDAPPGLFQKTYWTSQDRRSPAAEAFARSMKQQIGLATGGLKPEYAYRDLKPELAAARAIAAEASVRAKTIGSNDDEMKALIDWVNDPNSRNRRLRAKNIKTEMAIGGSYNFYEMTAEATGAEKLLPSGKYAKMYSDQAYLTELTKKSAVAALERKERDLTVAQQKNELKFGKWLGYYELDKGRNKFRLKDKSNQLIVKSGQFELIDPKDRKDTRPVVGGTRVVEGKRGRWAQSEPPGEDMLYVIGDGFYKRTLES